MDRDAGGLEILAGDLTCRDSGRDAGILICQDFVSGRKSCEVPAQG